MAEVKIRYFDFAGSRGEELRLALTLAGVPFEDDRIAGADFPAIKPDLPFGALPVVEIVGRGTFSQTNAILRLIGRLHGLHPCDPYEAARHDMLMDAAEELRHRISPSMRMEDPVAKKAAREALAAGFIPHWGRGVEALIGDGPFVGGERPAVVDVKLYMAGRWLGSGVLEDIPTDILDGCRRLKRVASEVARLPAVMAWYAATP
jgi:glutathione S-transferase